MSMKTSDRLIAPSRGHSEDVLDYAIAHDSDRYGDLQEYAEVVYALCDPDDMPDASVVIAQSCHETDAWQSHWWNARLNPAGLGITGDPAQNAASPTFETGDEAARAQVSHLLCYALGPADAGSLWFRRTGQPIKDADPRYDAYLAAYGNTAQAETIKDLAGTWATDTRYAEGIVARGNAIYPHIEDQEETPMTYSTAIPGLPRGPLITTYPIRFNLIAVDGFQRTGKKAATPRRSVQHGTGNPSNASAMSEAQYFVNGAEGRQASVHACSDDREVVVCMPLDEVAWHAADGAGPGNMNGYACEMMEALSIWTDPARRDKLIAITADFMGRVAARLDVHKPEKHYDFNAALPPAQRHHCPDKLMDTGLWDTAYVPQWNAARIDELRRMGGMTTTTTTTAAPAVYPPKPIAAPDTMSAQGYELAANDPARFRATVGQTRRTAPSRDAPAATKTPINKGRTYTFAYRTAQAIDGEVWYVTSSGNWVLAKGFEAA